MADLSEINHLLYEKETESVLDFFNNRSDKDKELTPEVISNITRNSVPENKRKRRVIVNWKEAVKSAAVVAGVAVVIINVTSVLSQKMAENKAVDKVISNSSMATVVHDAERTYRTPGRVEFAKDHETHDIADHLINKSEDFHEDLFITAHEISKEYDDATEEKVMDEILEHTSNINDENNPNYVLDYESWKDYCLRHGFVDSKGEPDIGKYMTEMASHIASEEKSETFENEHGLRSMR